MVLILHSCSAGHYLTKLTPHPHLSYEENSDLGGHFETCFYSAIHNQSAKCYQILTAGLFQYEFITLQIEKLD